MNQPLRIPVNPADAMQANLGFVTSQKTSIEAGVYRYRYPDLDYASLVPVDTSAHPFAKSITYFSLDGFGKAEWVNGGAYDIPNVGLNLDKDETLVHMAGIGYGYGYEEVGQAAMLGISLPSEGAYYANRAYQEMAYRVAFTGDTAKGFQGLFNYSGVTAGAVANDGTSSATVWSAKTGDLINRDINAVLIGMNSATNTVEMADTLILPIERFQTLASTRLGDTNMTILEFVRKNNVYTAMTGQPLDIRGMRGMTTIGSGTTARMVAYRKSPEVLKYHIPMPLRFLPVQVKGLRYEVPGVFRLGGLDIRLKGAVRYADGI